LCDDQRCASVPASGPFRQIGPVPFLELPPPSLHQQRDVIAEHYRLCEELYGPSRCCRVMRKFGIKYARLHPNSREVRDAFVAVAAGSDWRAVLKRWYAEDLPGVEPSPPTDTTPS
ncbi:MAG: hypothetical protein K8R46_08720, partial [Pirellulales bacterium]|nr:hypothetical protein [Pirellulales bacterium]